MDPSEIVAKLLEIQPDALDNLLRTLVEDKLVKATIAEQGGQIVVGGSHYVDTPADFDGKVNALAEIMHVRTGLHANQLERQLEKVTLEQVHGREFYKTDRYEWENANAAIAESADEYLASPDCPQSLRRAILEAGLLTVRGEAAKYARDIKSRFAGNPDWDV